MTPTDPQIEREIRRQQLIDKAVQVADCILLDGADGPEELNYLTAAVAKRWAEKALHPFAAQMLKKDLGL